MAIVCPECGSVNKKGNKFCYECGMRLPAEVGRLGPGQEEAQPQLRSSFEAKRRHLKTRWLKGEITDEEYRGHLLKLKLKERYGPNVTGDGGEGDKKGSGQE